MATPKTRTELINEAYSILALTDAPPEAEDVATIGSRVDMLFDQLAADRIIALDPDEIPTEAFDPVVNLLVNMCAPKYGAPRDRGTKAEDEQTLRRISSAKPTYEVMKAEYF